MVKLIHSWQEGYLLLVTSPTGEQHLVTNSVSGLSHHLTEMVKTQKEKVQEITNSIRDLRITEITL